MVLKYHRDWASVIIKDVTCSWRRCTTRLDPPQPEARLTKVISEPAWPLEIGSCSAPAQAVGLSGCMENHMLSSERKKYRMGPHQISSNSTHIPAPVPHLPRNVHVQTYHLIDT